MEEHDIPELLASLTDVFSSVLLYEFHRVRPGFAFEYKLLLERPTINVFLADDFYWPFCKFSSAKINEQ
jgi:hypothetical protein